jgi:uncharacterized repeat protein (TIGR01451 family)
MLIQKAVSKVQVTQGSRFNYTFNVKNLGSLDDNSNTAYNVIVTDTFPVGVAPTNSYWFEPEAASLSSGKAKAFPARYSAAACLCTVEDNRNTERACQAAQPTNLPALPFCRLLC